MKRSRAPGNSCALVSWKKHGNEKEDSRFAKDCFSERRECLVNIVARLGARDHGRHGGDVLRGLVYFLFRGLPLQIGLVRDEHDGDLIWIVLVEIRYPEFLDLFESTLARYIPDHDCPRGTLVVEGTHRGPPFLASNVPQRECCFAFTVIIDVDLLDEDVGTYRGPVIGAEFLFDECLDEGGFTCCMLAYYNDFEFIFLLDAHFYAFDNIVEDLGIMRENTCGMLEVSLYYRYVVSDY